MAGANVVNERAVVLEVGSYKSAICSGEVSASGFALWLVILLLPLDACRIRGIAPHGTINPYCLNEYTKNILSH
jgi:hypothetical protein